MNFNLVVLAGNACADPEVRNTKDGSAVAIFNIAVNRKYKDKEETTFCKIVSYGNTADFVSKYVKKGSPILVEGRLKQNSWIDENSGQKRYEMLVVAEKVMFTANKEKADEQPQQPQPPQTNVQQAMQQAQVNVPPPQAVFPPQTQQPPPQGEWTDVNDPNAASKHNG